MVQLNFNATGVKPNTALEAIPSGMYPVVIVRSEEKPTRAGNGAYIELEMQIQGGEYNGRKVFDRLNIKNPNQQAVDIAYATLSAICHVTGRLNITDTAQLHGVPFIAVVSKRVRDDLPAPAPGEQPQYSNEVKGYKDMNGNDPGFAGQVQQPAAQPQWAAQQPPVQQQAPQQQAPAWQQQPPAQQPVQQTAPVQQPPAQPQQTAPQTAPAWAQPPQGGAPANPPAWAQPQTA
jgi:hypothetical protein